MVWSKSIRPKYQPLYPSSRDRSAKVIDTSLLDFLAFRSVQATILVAVYDPSPHGYNP